MNPGAYRCRNCGAAFATRQQLGGHTSRRNCVAINRVRAEVMAQVNAQQTDPQQTNAQELPSSDGDSEDGNSPCLNPPVFNPPVPPLPARPLTFGQLISRPTAYFAKHIVQDVVIARGQRVVPQNTYKLHQVCIMPI